MVDDVKLYYSTTSSMNWKRYISTQTVKNGTAHAKKGSMKKVVKSKVAAQKWLWWSNNGKNFNSNNSSKLVLPPPTGNRHQNSLELLLLKILPLSDHHSHFWAATFDFTTFSCCLFLHRPHVFLTVWLFCVDFTPFCNWTCIFAFTGYS